MVNMRKRFDRLVSHLKENDMLNGAVGISCKGASLFCYHGMADRRNEISSRSTFDIASCAKTYTAVCILKSISRGKLQLDDCVAQHMPSFPYKDVTVRHLLNHTCGIREYLSLWNESSIADNRAVLDLVEACQKEISITPGTAFQYTNTGYVYLAELASYINRQDFDIVIQREIIEPFGLKNTFTGNHDKATSAIPFIRTEAGLTEAGLFPEGMRYESLRSINGDGNVKTTAEDFMKFVLALSDGLLLNEKEFERFIETPSFSNYGAGVIVENDPTYGLILSHGGSGFGTSSTFVNYTEFDAAIVYLSNAPEHIKTEQEIITALESVIFDQEIMMPEKYEQPCYMEIDEGEAQDLPGIYETTDGVQIHIINEQRVLYLQVEGQNRFILNKVNSGEFHISEVDLFVSFKENPAMHMVLKDERGTEAIKV